MLFASTSHQTNARTPHRPSLNMFGLRAWPVPFARPMWPFMIGGAMTFYMVASAQKAMLKSPVYRDDPRNPFKADRPAH
ncbi:BQ2448_5935 [Microbotryum intermedium]|uniref:BQ2448_5935 protein n=1 Tax=Microbotryum intermedium TaxID=269621 RepID=A0A238F3I3_9BASI|nr:BQ2448_5935 [Microbotryum intermedium]